MKNNKLLYFLFVLFFVFFLTNNTLAIENSLDIYFFWGNGCPHCAKEKEYLESLKEKYPRVNVHDFEIYNHSENIAVLKKISEEFDMRIDGVPFTIIGDQQFAGFLEYSSPIELEKRVEYCLENECSNKIGSLLIQSEEGFSGSQNNQKVNGDKDSNESGSEVETKEEKENLAKNNEEKISLPFIGEINPSSFSLPILAILMGVLDGFNPCAMWTLLFLISILLGMKNRKRMWILGTAFIVASASVYFLFMAAWLNLILFLGLLVWIRAIIGLVALLGGSYNIKEFFTNKESGCKVTNNEKRQKVFEKIKKVTQSQSFWLSLGGIILLAFAVNLVELICSAGLPAIFTQILALSELSNWQYYGYIILYIFFFMVDDLFIFFTAMITLHMTGITTKYTRLSKLVGGILMLLIGILLIFRPDLLMFG